MQLPPPLRNAIEAETARHSLPQLLRAAAELSERYRDSERGAGPLLRTEAHRIAYLAMRMPGTFAALRRVFAEAAALPIRSLLDLGAGPGTAAWAAAEVFPSLAEIAQIERDAGWVQLGRRLAQAGASEALRAAVWRGEDLAEARELPAADLVVASYALNELSIEAASRAALRAWEAARVAFAVIEPGTTAGFALVRRLREELLARGAHPLAPCPHASPCPMPAGDWCHFAARCERTALHRRLKGGALGYEDEKFSYLIATREETAPASARILRRPLPGRGFVKLALCTPAGLQQTTVTRNDEAWKHARKAEWGDALRSPSPRNSAPETTEED